jgi:hypothetical protein
MTAGLESGTRIVAPAATPVLATPKIPRPIVDPNATKVVKVKQLRAQRNWDKKYGAPAAPVPAESAPAAPNLRTRFEALRAEELHGQEYDPNSPVGRAADHRAIARLKKETGRPDLTFADLRESPAAPAPTAPRPAPEGGAKQPWEMTRAEWESQPELIDPAIGNPPPGYARGYVNKGEVFYRLPYADLAKPAPRLTPETAALEAKPAAAPVTPVATEAPVARTRPKAVMDEADTLDVRRKAALANTGEAETPWGTKYAAERPEEWSALPEGQRRSTIEEDYATEAKTLVADTARIDALKKSAKRLGSDKLGVGGGAFNDLVELGWHYFRQGFRTFATWGRQLVVDLGRNVGQFLRQAWVSMIRLHRNEIGSMGRQPTQAAAVPSPEQAAIARVSSKIAEVPSFWQRLGRVMRGQANVKDWMMTEWQNRFHPVNVAARRMTGLTDPQRQMPPEINFAGFAKVANLAAAAKAEAARNQGIRDVTGSKVLTPPLRDIIAPIAQRLRTDPNALKDFYAYAYALHALDVIKRGKNPGISEADARAVVDTLGNRPDFVETAKGLTGWYNAALDYYIDAGGLSPKAATAMRAMYPNYISLARQMETTGEGGPTGSKRLGGAVRRLKGSDRPILPPFETAVAYLERMIDLGDKVRFFRMFTEAAGKYPGGEQWAERVKPRIVASNIELRQLAKQLEEMGVDLGEADLDAVMTAFHARHFDDPRHHIFTIYRAGKPESWRIDEGVWDAVMGLNKYPRLPKIIDITFGAAARMRRLGTTGLRPGFSLITNPLRDTATAMLQGEQGANNPLDVAAGTIRGILSDLTNGEVARLWSGGGGEMAQPLGFDRYRLNRLVQETLADSLSAHARNWTRHPLGSTATWLRTIFSIPEAGPRIAQFERTVRAMGWKPGQPLTFEQYVQAQLEAANVTVDFREAGALGLWLNTTNAFFNPNIQGPARMASTIYRHPVRSILRGVSLMTVPTLALWWLYKDRDWYKRMTPRERGAYWHIEIGDTVVRIPRPFEWGYLFASIPEAALDSLYRSNPTAFKESFGQAWQALTPDFIPTLAEPPAEVWANFSMFRNAPLVSESLQRLPPAEQWTPRETETAKAIGRLLGVSPIYVQHLITEYTGGLSEDILGGAEQAARGLGALPTRATKPPELADRPVIGRVFLRPTAVRVFDDLYTERDSLAAREAAHRLNRGEPLSAEDAYRLKRMNIAAKTLGEYRRRVQKVIESDATDEAKRTELLRIHVKMVELAELVLRRRPSP